MKTYIAIDPGKQGAITFYTPEDNQVICFKTPLIGDDYDLNMMKQFLSGFSSENCSVGLEDVHAIQGQVGNSSQFSFGEGKGVWRGLVAGLGLSITLIQPRSWQKVAWEGVKKKEVPTARKKKDGSFVMKVDTKATSLIAAKRLFPLVMEINPPLKCYADSPENRKSGIAGQPLKKQPVPHDGIVDSLLIAYYMKVKNL